MRKNIKTIFVFVGIAAMSAVIFFVNKEINFQSCLINNSLFDCNKMMDE